MTRTKPRARARGLLTLVAAAAALAGTAALATETVTYDYDAHGRLTKAARAGTVNNGVVTTYTHDKADNRTNKTTSGAPAQ